MWQRPLLVGAGEGAAVQASTARARDSAACNATETLLIHKEILESALPPLAKGLAAAKVKIRADSACLKIIQSIGLAEVQALTSEDFDTEFLSLEIAVAVIDDVESAIAHINLHGSGHTDAIVTEDASTAEYFMARIDSAGVYHNASTRFADGFRYGFGAEVGVSTHRIHARGPVGLDGLLIYKYRLYGNGHGAGMYGSGKGQRAYLHEDIKNARLPMLKKSEETNTKRQRLLFCLGSFSLLACLSALR